MAEITAAAVMKLREITGLPMMDCKQALQATDGDFDKAQEWLRIKGKKWQDTKGAGRETSTGRIAIYAELEPGAGAMIDIRCETAPVANNEYFITLANDLAKQLAKGPGAKTPEELLAQPSPSNPKQTLQQQFDDLNNRIREKFVLARIVRVEGPCAGYVHHNGGAGVLLEVQKGEAILARDIAMHVTAMKPIVLRREEVDPAHVAKERDVLNQAMIAEGETIKAEAEKVLAGPEQMIQDPNNLEKSVSSHNRARGELKKAEGMVKNKDRVIEGRMGLFFAERCLLEQVHANTGKYASKTIGDLAKAAGMTIVRFIHWELPKE